jgi:hypothetical protein
MGGVMMKTTGFALVATLGVAALILILGLAMINMAQFNLQIASNSRINAEARYAAEGGIDAAIATLNQGVLDDSRELKIGDYLVLVTVEDLEGTDDSEAQEDEDNFDPAESEVDSEEQSLFLISSRAIGPRNSEYEASAVVAVDGSPASWAENYVTDPLNSGPGIVSEGTCKLNTSKAGGSLIPQGIHCNRGFDLKGGIVIGPGGNNDDATAACDSGGKRKCKCKDKLVISGHTAGDYCLGKKLPKYTAAAQSVPIPNYTALRNTVVPFRVDYTLNLGGSVSVKKFTDLVPGFVPASAPAQKVILISGTGDLELTAGLDLKNVVLLLQGRANVRISGAVKLENSMIVAERVRITGDLELNNSRLLANREVSVRSGTVTYSGVSTVASDRHVQLIQADITGPNDDKNILNLFANRDIKGAGYIKAQTALIAGGKFNYKQKKGKELEVEGSIMAKRDVKIKGVMKIRPAGATPVNSDLQLILTQPAAPDVVVEIVSRK